jgi:hypothetical protein
MHNWLVKEIVFENYKKACSEARDDFKNDWRLIPIYEHTPKVIADNYVKDIRKRNPDLLEMAWTNDLVGKPFIQDIEGWTGSNSTAMYIWHLLNMMDTFGDLNDLLIGEIGGGYGGQALTILDKFSPKKYDIYDLKEANILQQKVLGKLTNCYSKPSKKAYDLLISNYAISELKDWDVYLPMIKKAKHGYFTCNTDFITLDFPHERINDIEGERETNYILIW